jgi:hypothetical protein
MLRTPGAFISLTFLCTLGRGSEAQVLERVRTAATPPTAVTLDAETRFTLVRPLAGPTNLTATGTPAIARLRWDTVPGVIGYHVSRTDPAGATVKLTTDAITTSTSFEDLSGRVKPGLAYTYHVTAAYPNDGAGTAEVSFTPPAPAVPAWVRVIPKAAKTHWRGRRSPTPGPTRSSRVGANRSTGPSTGLYTRRTALRRTSQPRNWPDMNTGLRRIPSPRRSYRSSSAQVHRSIDSRWRRSTHPAASRRPRHNGRP